MQDLDRVLADATARLDAAGVESARHDAETLLGHVLGTGRSGLPRAGDLTADQAAEFESVVVRRTAREPLQHITGRAAFRYLDLEVGPGVFVPRPETEVLAGVAIDELNRLVDGGVEHPVALDLCTGSGALAVSMATEAAGSVVIAIELSEEAVAYARRNAAGHQVEVRLGDIADAADDLAGLVSVVTANPPYIPLTAWESVEAEVRDHDPAVALWSGEDGLDAIAVVAEVAARLLVDGGLIVCEHADVQGDTAAAIFATSGEWTAVRDNRDLAGRPRFVTARRAPRSLSRSLPTAGTMTS